MAIPVPCASESARGDGSVPAWKRALAAALRQPRQLCRQLRLPESLGRGAERAAERFPFLVPREYVARMRPADPNDPLLRQVLPRENELLRVEGFQADPVGDGRAARCPGLLQKYSGRALMVTTRVCPVHCRFCFRRHFSYAELGARRRRWQGAIEELAADRSIDEVILSGGDPLTLDDADLAQLLEMLAALPHVSRVRIHSRMPVMIPQRVVSSLLETLRSTRLPVILVVHVNHPAELDDAVGRALGSLVDAGIPVLNQSVLLRGVNDRLATLVELSRRLIDLRVMPYYLHQLDRAAGTAHFEVPESRGAQLVRQMQHQLPGYAVPRYVRELPGRPCKSPIV